MGKKVYKSIYTDNVFNTLKEAIDDGKRYGRDIEYRYKIKNDRTYNKYAPKQHIVPFIKNKRITLTNAGLATGGVLSTNQLDSIANGAILAGLPIKTAIGIATKESTLGNPTDDRTVYNLVNSRLRKHFQSLGASQNINKGVGFIPEDIINFYKPYNTPYEDAMKTAEKRATINGNYNHDLYLKYLKDGEKYADKQVEQYKKKYQGKNYWQAAFEDYKANPNGYNSGQPNYPQLVEKRGNEVWNSPEVQTWYKEYSKRRRSLEDN